MPVYSGLLIFFSLASLGLPGLSGFIGEFMTLVGTFSIHSWQTVVSVIGIVAAAAYMLKVMKDVLLGPLNDKWKQLRDINIRERLSLIPLLILVLLIGIFPLLMLQVQEYGIQALIVHILGS